MLLSLTRKMCQSDSPLIVTTKIRNSHFNIIFQSPSWFPDYNFVFISYF